MFGWAVEENVLVGDFSFALGVGWDGVGGILSMGNCVNVSWMVWSRCILVGWLLWEELLGIECYWAKKNKN